MMPNFLVSRNEIAVTNDTTNGNANVAKIAAAFGLGLKLKELVSEKGSDNICTNPTRVIHTGIIPTTIYDESL
jgi:hypothetical protein